MKTYTVLVCQKIDLNCTLIMRQTNITKCKNLRPAKFVMLFDMLVIMVVAIRQFKLLITVDMIERIYHHESHLDLGDPLIMSFKRMQLLVH